MEPYYYGRMNKDCQEVYRAMYQGFTELREQFKIPRLEGRELADVFLQLRLDHPEIFWVPSYRYQSYRDSWNIILQPEYLFERAKIREHQKAMKSRIEKLARQARGGSEGDKEKYVHDFICENIRYDKLKKPYSHEIIGPLGQGVGVCEGIAKTVKVLCDALDLWCMIPICANNPEKGIKYRHTWNIVRAEGRFFHLDATFDNSLTKAAGEGAEVRYDYFNLGDEQIFRDHEQLIYPAPPCPDGSHFYYRDKKLSFTRKEEVYKRALQCAKKGKTMTFHWRGGYLTRSVLEELAGEISRAGAEYGKKARVGLNWPQAVIRFSYEKDLAQDSLTMEAANEGEQE